MEQTTVFQGQLKEHHLPRYEELPVLELYKDQVVELTGQYLAPFFREDAPLTDTMVNNYVKLKVIAPPVKKRYQREQLAQLILTCLLKKVLSIAEVRQLLMLCAREGSIREAYNYFCGELEQVIKTICEGNQTQDTGRTKEERLLNHAACAFVHKLYFERALALSREEG